MSEKPPLFIQYDSNNHQFYAFSDYESNGKEITPDKALDWLNNHANKYLNRLRQLAQSLKEVQ